MADTKKLANVYNSDEELQQQILEEGGGGGGGDVNKEYVDRMDAEERQRAMAKENQLNEKIDNEITRATTEENNIKNEKQDKLTAGSDLSSVSDSTKISIVDLATKIITNFTLATLWNWVETKIKTTISSTSTDKDIVSGKLVYTELEKKLAKDWNYVGILSASSGSSINVKDDWVDLLVIIRVSEGSATYNLINVLPKVGFTQGSPTGKQTFAGFFWNESYNAKVRLGIEGSGDSQNLKLNYQNAIGWSINGLYIYKR